MKSISPFLVILTVFTVSVLLVTVHVRVLRGVNWLMSLGAGFMAAGLITSFVLFFVTSGSLLACLGRALGGVVVGGIFGAVFWRMGVQESLTVAPPKMILSSVAEKILRNEKGFIRDRKGLSGAVHWRDYARAAALPRK